jgi:hypothetical protein
MYLKVSVENFLKDIDRDCHEIEGLVQKSHSGATFHCECDESFSRIHNHNRQEILQQQSDDET